MWEDTDVNVAASQSVAKLLFLLKMKAKLSLQALGLCSKILKAAHLNNWLRGLTFLHRSAVSLATLTSKPAYSILCGLSNITPLVLPPPQPQDYAPPGSCIALLCCCGLPSSRRCWMVAAPLLLAWSWITQCRSSWTSAVTSSQTPSLRLNFLVSFVAPAICTGPPDASLYIRTMLFPAALTAVLLFPPCWLRGTPSHRHNTIKTNHKCTHWAIWDLWLVWMVLFPPHPLHQHLWTTLQLSCCWIHVR